MATKERVIDNVITDKREIYKHRLENYILVVISGANQFDDLLSFLFRVSADSHEEFL